LKAQLDSSIKSIQTEINDLENEVKNNKSKIDSKEPINEEEISKLNTELTETKTKLKNDLAKDADLLFDQRIKNKIISDDYLNKIVELSLDNKLINLKSSITSVETQVNEMQ